MRFQTIFINVGYNVKVSALFREINQRIGVGEEGKDIPMYATRRRGRGPLKLVVACHGHAIRAIRLEKVDPRFSDGIWVETY